MAKRGRKSQAEAEQPFAVIEGTFVRRPEPPHDLTEDEAVIWRGVVAGEPAEWFTTEATRGLLKNYCRHQATADKLTAVINIFEVSWLKSADGVKRFNDLARMRDRQVHAAVSLATKLRLTNQARFSAAAASTATRKTAPGLKPWEA
jgi:hypothetical protein